MASVLTYFYDFIERNADPRTKNWFLMDSPFILLSICLTYVVLVKYIGPKLMENRRPMELSSAMVYYNLGQVTFNAWLFYNFLKAGWGGEYNFRCEPLHEGENTGKPMIIASFCYYFFLSKFSDFIDTFFFIVRKKYSHISALHVVHHATTPISGEFEDFSKFSFFKLSFRRMGWNNVWTSRTWNIHCSSQQFHSRSHVQLLYGDGDGTKRTSSKFMAKAWNDNSSNPSIHSRHNSFIPIAFHGL
jgi:hypothetical protein